MRIELVSSDIGFCIGIHRLDKPGLQECLQLTIQGVQRLYYLFYRVLILFFGKTKTFECLIRNDDQPQLQLENQA